MSERFYLVTKYDVEYGSQIFQSYAIDDMNAFLDFLNENDVNTYDKEVYDGVCVEIEVDTFKDFYKRFTKYEANPKDKTIEFIPFDGDPRVYEDIKDAIQEIKKLIDTNPEYINRLGYVVISYF